MKYPGCFLAILPLALGPGEVRAATFTFRNTSGITMGDGVAPYPPAPVAGAPYPSTINVTGVTGTVLKVTVQLTGLTHTFPDDLDVLLVGPNGEQAMIMSDCGGDIDVNNIKILFDDNAAALVPNATAIASGNYRPTNNIGEGVISDPFPAPAPAAVGDSVLSTFQGINPNGTWSLYVVDDSVADSGSITSWTLNIITAAPALPGQLVISEFRVRGPSGINDEFVEIQNATDLDHIVTSIDGSAGYAVASSDGVVRFVIPNGTVIHPRGHYLGTNSISYSLSSYPAGKGTTATGDATYTTDIPDNAGIALFRTATPANFTLANRLDAVGSLSEGNTLYKEGSGYPPITPYNIDSSFHRNLLGGVSQDTGDNAADFVFVDTNGTSAGAGQRLGAPGPETLFSPIRLRSGPPIVRELFDSGAASISTPNRIRDFTSSPASNSSFGTIELRRKFTNLSGFHLSLLRFRVVDLTTFPSPSGIADLRPRASAADEVVALTGGTNAFLRGTTLEQAPYQPNGGGFNSTFNVTNVAGMSAGSSFNVRFLFGIQQTGSFRIALIPESVPASAAGVWILSGNTENTTLEEESSGPAPAILELFRFPSDVALNYFCPPGSRYQFQQSLNLTTWTDIGPTLLGDGSVRSYTHSGGIGPANQFYRLKPVP